VIEPAFIYQFFMFPGFNDCAVSKYEYFVSMFYGFDSVGDNDAGLFEFRRLKRVYYFPGCCNIKGRQGIVKDENRCLNQKCPGNAQALLLAAGKRYPFFADQSVKAVFEIHDFFYKLGMGRISVDLFITSTGFSKGDVFQDGI